MPTFPFPEDALIHTRAKTGTDGDGNDVYSDVTVTTSGAFAPEGSTELIQGQATLITNPTFYLSDGAPVPSASDRLEVRGVVYEIDGQPQEYRNPFTGSAPGAVLRLERVTG